MLKAITQRAAQPAAPARPATPPPPPVAVPPTVAPPKPAPPVTASTQPAAPVEPPKPAPRFITPQSVARPPAAIVIPPKPPAAPVKPAVEAAKTAEAARRREGAGNKIRRDNSFDARSRGTRDPRNFGGRNDYYSSSPGACSAAISWSNPCAAQRCCARWRIAFRSSRSSSCASGAYRTAGGQRSASRSRAATHRSADGTASGLHRAGASGPRYASASGHAGAGQADLPASAASGRATHERRSGNPSADASGRTPWSASDSLWGSGNASAFRCRRARHGATAADRTASHGTSGSSGTALCTAWCEGRPDEGLYSAAASLAIERAAAHHARHHDSGRYQREGFG